MNNHNHQAIEFEESSGNVFADLGLDHAPQLLARAEIGFHVYQILKQKNLKQREIAQILGISPPDVSHLMNGHFSRFTIDKLLEFLQHLNMKVTICITPHEKGEPFQQVAYLT